MEDFRKKGSPSHSGFCFEVCADSLDAVAKAIAGGAGRVELCRELDTGGLTPDSDDIRRAVAMAREAGRPFAVNVLVRPRPGDFVYDVAEKRDMLNAVADICRLGVDGVVIGALDSDGTVDAEWTRSAVAAAHDAGVSVTFHRAFDRVADFAASLEALVKIGVDRILTSGCPTCAADGTPTLAMLVSLTDGHPVIMPGGGVRSSNIRRIREATGAREFHSSCKVRVADAQVTELDEIRSISKIMESFS